MELLKESDTCEFTKTKEHKRHELRTFVLPFKVVNSVCQSGKNEVS